MTEHAKRLLLVDDDEFFRCTTAARLRHLGYEVREAAGGEDALAAVSEDLDLVLLDLGLPDRDGFEVLELLGNAWPELPLLVVSGAEEVAIAVEALRKGAWDYLLKPLGDREHLVHALNRAFERRDLLRENRTYREHLEEQVADRTRRLEEELVERRRVEEELRHSQENLRSLASELSLAEERERRRVAVDLHDGVGQTLALLKLKFVHLRRTAGEALPAQPFEDMGALVEEAIARVRALTVEVSSPVLYEVGFEAAVSALAGKTLDEHGIFWTVNDDWQPKPLAEDVKVLLFQVVRELLHNVVKHAQARRVTITLRREGAELVCTVADDGKGGVREAPDAPGRKGGFGLFSIRERLLIWELGSSCVPLRGRGPRGCSGLRCSCLEKGWERARNGPLFGCFWRTTTISSARACGPCSPRTPIWNWWGRRKTGRRPWCWPGNCAPTWCYWTCPWEVTEASRPLGASRRSSPKQGSWGSPCTPIPLWCGRCSMRGARATS